MGEHRKISSTAAQLAAVQRYAKAITALVGAVLTAGVVVLPDDVQLWVGLGMAVLTTVGTYAVPNRPPSDE
ncbi:hypothetical protein [Curtobacterium sp. MCBA15_004]|uniref:DUF7439 family protein n=1 Tax=Curtobacterium sp. MCBA15_004 TaxID=1898733 RepID=UPI0008DD2B3D|nr:hypothetical protein [Curtobacterium sp. MCBA15_004]WIA98023.1 hypothetical protein QOL16_06450 [Curtobacterium sp. MCBA15_004]